MCKEHLNLDPNHCWVTAAMLNPTKRERKVCLSWCSWPAFYFQMSDSAHLIFSKLFQEIDGPPKTRKRNLLSYFSKNIPTEMIPFAQWIGDYLVLWLKTYDDVQKFVTHTVFYSKYEYLRILQSGNWGWNLSFLPLKLFSFNISGNPSWHNCMLALFSFEIVNGRCRKKCKLDEKKGKFTSR